MDCVILERAKDLFFSYGVKNVSMDDLARGAGISKKKLYEYFADKNDAVKQAVSSLINAHTRIVQQCNAAARNAVEEVLLQSDALLETWASVNETFFFELERSFPDTWKALEAHRTKLVAPAIGQNLQRGIDEGIYRQNLDGDLVTNIRMQQLRTALQPVELNPGYRGKKGIIGELTSFYLHAITNEKGKNILHKYLKNSHEKRTNQ